MYALIEFAGKQFRVEEGSTIKVPYIDDKVGSKVPLDKILYMDDGKNKMIGTPLVNGVKINGEITSHGRERKVVVFKFKRRKGYQKKNTHRQEYSILKVGKLGKVKKAPSEKTTAKVATKTKVAPKKVAAKNTTLKKPSANKATQKKPKESKE